MNNVARNVDFEQYICKADIMFRFSTKLKMWRIFLGNVSVIESFILFSNTRLAFDEWLNSSFHQLFTNVYFVYCWSTLHIIRVMCNAYDIMEILNNLRYF